MTTTAAPLAPEAPGSNPRTLVQPLTAIRHADVSTVGGKAANLGELIAAGFPVPPGFVLPVDAYLLFYERNRLGPRIAAELHSLDVDDPASLERTAAAVRSLILAGRVPDDLADAIHQAYDDLAKTQTLCRRVAVRSSATAEDTAQFSFAGMFESFLNVVGASAVVDAVKACWASTFTGRVLFYRIKQGLPAEMPVAVIVQRMVNSNKSGVMFTSDPATRDSSRIVVEAAWGLGEAVVQGAVTPDRHVLDKASLGVVMTQIARKEFLLAWDAASHATIRVDLTTDPRASAPVLTSAELAALGDLARRAEAHYGEPQDLEFAIEGDATFLTQSRPITTLQPATHASVATPEMSAKPVVHGLGASPGTGVGAVRVLASPSEESVMQAGEVLVTRMTSPDWVPIMRRAAAIVTDAGGMTSHAAIVARELGLPCVVGTHDATRALSTGTIVTVDGAAGTVSIGRVASDSSSAAGARVSAEQPRGRSITATKLYVNLAEPDRAEAIAARDVDGVGLLRAEFMMLEALDHMHPRAFLGEHSGDDFVHRMSLGLRTFAQAFAPRPVIYRAMDFRSNEFRNLTGGAEHEPVEANPMIGYRGCQRYLHEPELFALELRALAEVRREFENLHLMIPFVRTPAELAACLGLVDASALGGDSRLERWIMAEVPSVVYRLPEYAALGITGVSIGSNDLTQLMLGVDRDSELFGAGYDERDAAVLDAIRSIVTTCRELGLTCSICGQAPSVYPSYAAMLVRLGIDSISVNVDAIDRTRHNIAVAEQSLILEAARSRDGASRGTPDRASGDAMGPRVVRRVRTGSGFRTTGATPQSLASRRTDGDDADR
jgi:pyruvate, water dikinase